MADDIKYIGVEPDYTQSPKESNAVSKIKKDKTEKKEKFRINKHNSKVDDFIASTKPKSKYTGKLIAVLLIVLIVWVFKPITFLKAKLDEKRMYYAMQDDSNSLNLDLKFGLWSNIVYYTSYNYYKDLRGTLINPLSDSTLNKPYDFAHNGVDLNGYSGQEVMCANYGVVVDVGNDSKHGNYVLVKHVIKDYTIYTYYANLNTTYVYVGQYLSQYQVIGTISGKDNVQSVMNDEHSHLHFAVRKDIKESSGMDPFIFIQK